MVNVDIQQLIPANIHQVHQILLKHEQLDRFFDAKFCLRKSAVPNAIEGGEGCVREVTVLGVVFSEEILKSTLEHISYAIIGDKPLSGHQGNIYLTEQSKNETYVHYTIICQAPKWLPDKLVGFLLSQGIKKAMLKLKQYFVQLNKR